jgi:hypothetical protein
MDGAGGMMRHLIFVTVGASMLLAGCGRAPVNSGTEAPIPPLVALTCHFKDVYSGAISPVPEKLGSGGRLDFTFAALNPEAQTAQMIGNAGVSDVTYWRPDGQLQFLEHTISGNITMTSVFAPATPSGPMPAVHSRHIWLGPNNVIVSQMTGTCDPKSL